MAGRLGLYILPTGNLGMEGSVTAISQEPQPGSQADSGSTVTLRFADQTARD